MCIVGFLQLRLLRYKNKREIHYVIVKKMTISQQIDDFCH